VAKWFNRDEGDKRDHPGTENGKLKAENSD
jgi:hypothetical protein